VLTAMLIPAAVDQAFVELATSPARRAILSKPRMLFFKAKLRQAGLAVANAQRKAAEAGDGDITTMLDSLVVRLSQVLPAPEYALFERGLKGNRTPQRQPKAKTSTKPDQRPSAHDYGARCSRCPLATDRQRLGQRCQRLPSTCGIAA
jgi:hypothetical protein